MADLDRPLPPGDYTLNVLAFCTEYSVHRPGAGVAYRLGPLQGKAASAIGDLLWRGTLEKNVQPRQLQAVSWAIQSGLHYDQMPRMYQSVIDNVIPEHRSQLNGDFIQSLETPPIPPVPPTPVLSLLSSSHRGGNNGEFKGDHKNTKNYNVVTFYQTNPTVLRQKTPALLKCNGL